LHIEAYHSLINSEYKKRINKIICSTFKSQEKYSKKHKWKEKLKWKSRTLLKRKTETSKLHQKGIANTKIQEKLQDTGHARARKNKIAHHKLALTRDVSTPRNV
jgi:hypothetical protein